MGPIEWVFFGAGAISLAVFSISTLYPYTVERIEEVAERRSNHLKNDFLHLSTRRVILVFLILGVIAGAVLFWVAQNIWWSLLASALPVFLSGLAVRRYRRRRCQKVVSQLPTLLDTISGYIKAGHSFPEALSHAIPLLPRGIREDVAWLSRMNRLGTPLPEAFLAWERNNPSPEMTLVARPMRVALSSGGNVTTLLERIRNVLRSRQRQQDKMRSMTAQARLQALVLTMLPPIFLLVLTKMDPGFWRAITTTPVGRTILVLATTLQFLGWVFIRKMLAVKP
ncbi:MAG TPA: type II secretion system F family protein [Candidatus Deferrimicrobiaceae bacterium]|jgi:tight adherence protein B